MIIDYRNDKNPEIVINESIMERLPAILGNLYYQPYMIPTYDGTLLLEYNYPFKGYDGYGYLTFELTEDSIDLYANGNKEQLIAQQSYTGLDHVSSTEVAKLDWFFINTVLEKYNRV